ncbi:hypothetical protein Cni_G05238 [Canna indica]|uniref:Uncharacterized protein n=1 Tax=Canna indica TaxID=4628 RepID=A0AAQ3JUU2_9LILI|nr:hypothetical protein Cni_G05238 [Canna indica]
MEGHADLRDWEILLSPEVGVDLKPLQEEPEDDPEDGVIMSDYFAFDSGKQYHKIAAFDRNSSEVVLVDGPEAPKVDPDKPSWIDPESDAQFLDRSKAEVGFPGIELPRSDDLGRFWSDESSDGQRSCPGSEKNELGDTVEVDIGEITGRDNEAEEEIGLEGIQGSEMRPEKPDNEEPGECVKDDERYNSSVIIGDNNIGQQNVLSRGGEKRVIAWWKFPFELLKFSAFRVKPVWSISIAAAILGILVLGKRLYRIKHKSISIPLKLSLDEKVKFFLSLSSLNQWFHVLLFVSLAGSLVNYVALMFALLYFP